MSKPEFGDLFGAWCSNAIAAFNLHLPASGHLLLSCLCIHCNNSFKGIFPVPPKYFPQGLLAATNHMHSVSGCCAQTSLELELSFPWSSPVVLLWLNISHTLRSQTIQMRNIKIKGYFGTYTALRTVPQAAPVTDFPAEEFKLLTLFSAKTYLHPIIA